MGYFAGTRPIREALAAPAALLGGERFLADDAAAAVDLTQIFDALGVERLGVEP